MSTERFKEFGARLRDARQKAGISQSQLARDIGATPSIISSYEAGRFGPGRDNLQKIANRFQTTVSHLLEGITPQGDITPPASLSLHPKIEAKAKDIMEREGFTSMAQLVTWFVKEDERRHGSAARTPGSLAADMLQLDREMEEMERENAKTFGEEN